MGHGRHGRRGRHGGKLRCHKIRVAREIRVQFFTCGSTPRACVKSEKRRILFVYLNRLSLP